MLFSHTSKVVSLSKLKYRSGLYPDPNLPEFIQKVDCFPWALDGYCDYSDICTVIKYRVSLKPSLWCLISLSHL